MNLSISILIWLQLLPALPGSDAGAPQAPSRPPRLVPYYSDRDCGPVSLAVICRLRNVELSIDELYRMIPLTKKGANAAQLVEAARKLGLNPVPVKCSVPALIEKNIPAIIELKQDHVAVFVGVSPQTGKLLILDLPNKPSYLTAEQLEPQWGGRAILFPPAPGSTVPADQPPRIDVSPKIADLGLLWQGDKALCTFTILNNGPGELHILDVRLSCACTTTELDCNVVSPGDSAVLKVTYDSSGSARESKDVAKQVNIVTNAEPSTHFMEINAKVRPRYVLSPDSVSMNASNYTDLSALTTRIEIRFFDNPKTAVTRAESSAPWLSLKRLPDPDSQSATVLLELAVSALPSAAGRTTAQLLLHTDNTNYPVIAIPVLIDVQGDYEVLPSKVYMGVVEPNSQLTRTFRIRKLFEAKPFSIARIHSDTIPAKPIEQPRDLGNDHSFSVQLTAPQKLGRFSADIVVILSDNQSTRIPVFGFVREKKP